MSDDRGDEFIPTNEEDDKAIADAAAEIAKIESEKKAAELEKKTEKTEEEVKAEEEAATKAEGENKKDTRIPLSRHEKLMEKGRLEREALVAENEKLRQGQALAKTNETIDKTEEKLLTMEAEYNELLGKGEIEKATAKMTEIRRTERQISDAKVAFQSQVAENAAYERVRYDTTVDRIEEAYPELNEDADEFDKASSEQVVKLMMKFVKAGDDRATSLKEAVRLVMGAPKSRVEKQALDADVKVSKDAIEAERKAAALKKNVEASKKQPSDLSKVGLDSDKGDTSLTANAVMKMSQKEFAALSEADLAKLRGDSM